MTTTLTRPDPARERRQRHAQAAGRTHGRDPGVQGECLSHGCEGAQAEDLLVARSPAHLARCLILAVAMDMPAPVGVRAQAPGAPPPCARASLMRQRESARVHRAAYGAPRYSNSSRRIA